ncbi:OmpA family protein [Phaeospirillum tilakii]|uniref:OmpA family protein n=1 Tax=Phaeospirillum tilakii TaxID=741673 RepID=A0ABW5CC94_9PROT
MKHLKIMLATAAAVVAMPALAHAQWYVGADVGASFLEDNKTSSSSGASHKVTSDTGWLAAGQAGYAFGPWKVEGELSWRDNGVDKTDGRAAHGSTTVIAPMVNGIYEFLPESRVHPFVGVGVGVANVDAGSVTVNGTKVYHGDDWQFAYQGFAGVGVDVAHNVALKAQYRYFSTLDYDTKANVVAPGTRLSNEYHDHAVLVGFTYKFGSAPQPAPEPIAAPPAPPPAPAYVPPAPKPVAAKRNFMVFFDFDKTAITPEASRIIQQAATTARTTGAARIELTGHTDLSGSERYNQRLSVNRANAVKAELVKQGIPASQIDVVGKGKSSPLVATADGVREPQNRRVEIVLP